MNFDPDFQAMWKEHRGPRNGLPAGVNILGFTAGADGKIRSRESKEFRRDARSLPVVS